LKHDYRIPTCQQLTALLLKALVVWPLILFSYTAWAIPPVNDEPAAATPLLLTTTCATSSGSTVDATPSVQPAADGVQDGGGSRTDVFYTFIAPCSRISFNISNVRSTTYPTRNAFGNLTLYRFDAGSYSQEPYNGSALNSVLNFTRLIPGQQYYIRVQTLVSLGNGTLYGSPATFALCAMVPPTVFAPATAYPHSFRDTRGDELKAGDWNADGYPDLVASHITDQEIQVLLNQQNGTFSGANSNINPFNSEWRQTAVGVGDLDNDGRADLALAGNTRPNSSSPAIAGVEVRFNRASGPSSLVRYSTNPGTLASPREITLSDVNNDGFLDIIATNYYTRNVSFALPCSIAMLLNNGNGTFAPAAVYELVDRIAEYADQLITCDVNGDGFMDIVTVVTTGPNGLDKIGVLVNSGTGTFAPIRHLGPAQNSGYTSLAAGDVNEDRAVDLVILNTGSPDGITVFLNQGNGNFAPGSSVYAYRSDLKKVVLADFNNDAALDILVATNSHRMLLLFNNRNGTFGKGGEFLEESYVTTLSTSLGDAPDLLAIDANLDGKADIAANNFSTKEIAILLNQGPCVPTTIATAPAPSLRESISLAPNPAHGSTTVYASTAIGATPASVTLRDALGRCVRTYRVTRAQTPLDLGGLLPGVYVIHLQAGEQTVTRRLLVE
jgi:hypothetical protein